MKTGPIPMTKEQAVDRALAAATRLENGCLIRENKATAGAGYKVIGCCGTQFYAHRLVYEVKVGAIYNGVVRHTCDTPACINPKHLISGSHADNVLDKVRKNRQGHGSKHYASILTDKDVVEIRSIKPPRFTKWAARFMMSTGAIKAAYYGYTWKHIPMQTRAQETLTYVRSEDWSEEVPS
jgi:hypothetical protein